MSDKNTRDYSDFSNVKSNRNELVPEEFPEGSLGSPINQDVPVQNKSTPWQEGQRRQSAFIYADKGQHEKHPRKAPGAHQIHDHPEDKKKQ